MRDESVKIEAGCGMTEILIAGCGVKIRRRDVLHFAGGIGDSSRIFIVMLHLYGTREETKICAKINSVHTKK